MFSICCCINVIFVITPKNLYKYNININTNIKPIRQAFNPLSISFKPGKSQTDKTGAATDPKKN